MEHIVLLGDSTFDNKAYVGEAPDVVNHLRNMMPKDWKATLCAVDRAKLCGIKAQIPNVPRDATHLFVSVGGNDALMRASLVFYGNLDATSLLALLAKIGQEFRADYMEAIEHLCSLQKPVCVCTIYHGNMARDLVATVEAAVGILDDKIYSVANEKGLSVIDLRRICRAPEDFANPIEPSDVGGKKIAKAILEQVQTRNRRSPVSVPISAL